MSTPRAKTFLMQIHVEPDGGFSIHRVIVVDKSYSAWFNEVGVCVRATRTTLGDDGKPVLADTLTTRSLSAVGREIHRTRKVG